jgi:hypothetical protein
MRQRAMRQWREDRDVAAAHLRWTLGVRCCGSAQGIGVRKAPSTPSPEPHPWQQLQLHCRLAHWRGGFKSPATPAQAPAPGAFLWPPAKSLERVVDI